MKAARLWPAALVAVLGITVVANALLLYAAHDRDAAVVERDYYRKAMTWDSTLAQERRNAELGWRLDAELGAVRTDGFAPLRVRLAGRDGAPVAGAAIRVEAIHNRDARRVVAATLATGADGRGEVALRLGRAGQWELRFEATRGAERFTADLRREAGGPTP
jgi:nitrogen fixation protein FixH